VDDRCDSLASALAFIKSNNILGICVPANIMMSVPSLSSAIKETGVLLISQGSEVQSDGLKSLPTAVDGFKINGSVQFYDAFNAGKMGML